MQVSRLATLANPQRLHALRQLVEELEEVMAGYAQVRGWKLAESWMPLGVFCVFLEICLCTCYKSANICFNFIYEACVWGMFCEWFVGSEGRGVYI